MSSKCKRWTSDIRGKPLINLDRRHKTPGADKRPLPCCSYCLKVQDTMQDTAQIVTKWLLVSVSVNESVRLVNRERSTNAMCLLCPSYDLSYPIYSYINKQSFLYSRDLQRYSLKAVIDPFKQLRRLSSNRLYRVFRGRSLCERYNLTAVTCKYKC